MYCLFSVNFSSFYKDCFRLNLEVLYRCKNTLNFIVCSFKFTSEDNNFMKCLNKFV